MSEGRDSEILSELGAAAATGAHLLDSGADPDHNRAVLTLAGEAVELGAFALTAAAVRRLDIRIHRGAHPRRGVVDVIPLVPLGGTPMETAVASAQRLGERIWNELGVPVYLYGAAGKHTLARIRSATPPAPDLGHLPHPTAGVVCVGARGPLIAYNVLLKNLDLAGARRIAAALRESSGGIRGIQALVFPVAGGLQVSMNLTRPDECPPTLALAHLREVAGASHVGADEVIGLIEAHAARGCEAADGKLFEARLASAAGRAAALRCRSREDSEEMLRLAQRLESEATSLATLGWPAALEGAERSAALIRVLHAGRIGSAELDAMLSTAAEGFRRAVGGNHSQREAARVTALDRWLANPPGEC